MGIWTTIVVLATVVAGGLTVGRWMLAPPGTRRPATVTRPSVTRHGRSRPRHAR
ncbi:MAG TPA: hypothetical protein VGJ44_07510 [Kribbellaceae bacterium]